jgi:hypothetical protein
MVAILQRIPKELSPLLPVHQLLPLLLLSVLPLGLLLIRLLLSHPEGLAPRGGVERRPILFVPMVVVLAVNILVVRLADEDSLLVADGNPFRGRRRRPLLKVGSLWRPRRRRNRPAWEGPRREEVRLGLTAAGRGGGRLAASGREGTDAVRVAEKEETVHALCSSFSSFYGSSPVLLLLKENKKIDLSGGGNIYNEIISGQLAAQHTIVGCN